MDQRMDAVNDLCKDVKQCLEEKPILWNRLLSTVDEKVLELLEKKNSRDKIEEAKPEQPELVELINMLISEYMDFMGFKITNSMFMKELGTEFKSKGCRKRMTSLLDLEDNNESLQLPLLTVLITMFKNKNEDNNKTLTD